MITEKRIRRLYDAADQTIRAALPDLPQPGLDRYGMHYLIGETYSVTIVLPLTPLAHERPTWVARSRYTVVGTISFDPVEAIRGRLLNDAAIAAAEAAALREYADVIEHTTKEPATP